ncbi:hypothetical protein [Pedobacter glucosidilyticus]|uniref:hypothetical protein n=1 Tax=Pedobacter glucosidilyticus TaxID=1122941 RepID=UPI000479CD03|nr:hypothetical protein [Pedobacter glucosidilyticus]
MNIFSHSLFDTAVSIFISWALFSLLCSYIHETIAQIKEERGRFLKQRLLKQFQDLPNGINWASLLYLHGAVNMLSRKFNKPPYEISVEVFAKTIIEVVGNAHLVQINENSTTDTYQNVSLRNYKKAVGCLQHSDMLALFEQSLKDAENKNLKEGRLQEDGVYLDLLLNLQTWYQNFLAQVSDWYKKKTRRRLFMIGTLIAMLLNVDSIELFKHFNTDETSRKTLIAFYTENKASLEQQALEISNLDAVPQSTPTLTKLKVISAQLDSLSKEAELPVGFNRNFYSQIHKADDIEHILMKLLGFLLSGFAVSFGAPFWFELLKKIYTKKTN